MQFSLRRSYLAAFLVPVLSMLLIFIIKGFYPFGEQCFLRTDMYHQYAPFFQEFHDKLTHGDSLYYSWEIGMGTNFMAIIAYYLASPLNLLLILCPQGFVIEFMTVMVVLKMGLCGVTMNYFLRHHFGDEDISTAAFAILYAMSGYISAYSWNLMWLDCIVLFPLIMLGFERLMLGGSGMLYVITLGLSIFSNYYISIMTCIFLVLWFFAQCILQGTDSPRAFFIQGLRFAFYSALAGGLAAVVLLPEIYALQMTASVDSTFPKTFTQYFTILDMLARQLPFVDTEQGLEHWPNVYCGSFILMLLPLFFFHPGIRLREKGVYGFFVLFFFLSFSVNVLNYIWHGFHYPNSLPCRQGYLYVFLLLDMGYQAFRKRSLLSRKEIAAALGFSVCICILTQKFADNPDFHFMVFYAAIAFLAGFYLFFCFENGAVGKSAAVYLLILVSSEAALNMGLTSVTTTSRTAYLKDNADVRKLVSEAKALDGEFCRFEKMTRKTKDDGAWLDFPSVSIFSSTAYKAGTDFFRQMGMEASTNSYSITGSTPLINMLLGVKYNLYSELPEEAENRDLTQVDALDEAMLYRFEDALPVGFVLSEKALDDWAHNGTNPAANQNALCRAMGTEDVLIEVPVTLRDKDADFLTDKDGEYYGLVKNKALKEVRISSTGRDKDEHFKNLDRGYFMELGYLHDGETLAMHAETENQKMNVSVWRVDYAALRSLRDALSKNVFSTTAVRDDLLQGRVNGEGGILFFSIPYDEGWQAAVDGEPVEIRKLKDTFLGVPVSDGLHEITLRFIPQGLKIGACISGTSLVILLLTALFTHFFGNSAQLLIPEDEDYIYDADDMEAEEDGSYAGRWDIPADDYGHDVQERPVWPESREKAADSRITAAESEEPQAEIQVRADDSRITLSESQEAAMRPSAEPETPGLVDDEKDIVQQLRETAGKRNAAIRWDMVAAPASNGPEKRPEPVWEEVIYADPVMAEKKGENAGEPVYIRPVPNIEDGNKVHTGKEPASWDEIAAMVRSQVAEMDRKTDRK